MLNENEKFFSITAAAGHVGEGNFIPIRFPVIARNKQDASNQVLGRAGYTKTARVKIGWNGMAIVLDAAEISKEEYWKIKRSNKRDPYLRAKNAQEQRRITSLDRRIITIKDKYADNHDDEFILRKIRVKKDIATRAFG